MRTHLRPNRFVHHSSSVVFALLLCTACSGGGGGGDTVDPPATGALSILVVEDVSYPYTQPTPIAGATVRVVDANGVSIQGTTDPEGRVGFDGLTAPLDVTAQRSQALQPFFTNHDVLTVLDVNPTDGQLTLQLGFVPTAADTELPDTSLSGTLDFAPGQGSSYSLVAQTRSNIAAAPVFASESTGDAFGAQTPWSAFVPSGELIDLAAVQGDTPVGSADVIAIERMALVLGIGPLTGQLPATLDVDLGATSAIDFDQFRTVTIVGEAPSASPTLEISFNMTDPTTGSCFEWTLLRDDVFAPSYTLALPDPADPKFGGYRPYLDITVTHDLGGEGPTRQQVQTVLLALDQVEDLATIQLPEAVTVTALDFEGPGALGSGSQITIAPMASGSGFVQVLAIGSEFSGVAAELLTWQIYAPMGSQVLTLPALPTTMPSIDADDFLLGGTFLWGTTDVTYDDLFGPDAGLVYGDLIVTPGSLRASFDIRSNFEFALGE